MLVLVLTVHDTGPTPETTGLPAALRISITRTDDQIINVPPFCGLEAIAAINCQKRRRGERERPTMECWVEYVLVSRVSVYVS